MASFEHYNLPYNYTTAVTLTKTLSILVSVNFLTCGWTPNSCFFPRLKIFCGLLLQIVIPHYLCKGKRDSIKEPIRTFRAKYSILENKTRKCMRTHIHVPQTQTSLTFLIAKNILLLYKQWSRSRKFSTHNITRSAHLSWYLQKEPHWPHASLFREKNDIFISHEFPKPPHTSNITGRCLIS